MKTGSSHNPNGIPVSCLAFLAWVGIGVLAVTIVLGGAS